MLIRYPGSKDKHIKYLSEFLMPMAQEKRSVFEPFSGTAAVTFHLLDEGVVNKYWINDIDQSMQALWTVVRDSSDDLIKLVRAYVPRAEDFYEFKANSGTNLLEQAYRKLVLHQISYSGLGVKAGSPIGGREQKGNYLVNCRWNPERLSKKIEQCSKLLNSVDGNITSLDWKQTLLAALEEDYFVYLDPPYYRQGGVLYMNGTIDHTGLANELSRHRDSKWAVSYDDVPEIRGMYSWANILRLDVRSHLHHQNIGDVIIRPW